MHGRTTHLRPPRDFARRARLEGPRRGTALPLALAALCAVAACGDDDGAPTDSAVGDSARDVGAEDTGRPTSDGGDDSAVADDSGADSGALPDAGPDAAAPDASPSDSGADAAPGPSCRPERVTPIIIAGGPFAVGVLCDDVFVCAADAGDAAAVLAAAPEFACAAEAGAAGRCSSYTCTYRDPGGPSVVDEAEYQSVCAVTLLEPAHDIYCAVYP